MCATHCAYTETPCFQHLLTRLFHKRLSSEPSCLGKMIFFLHRTNAAGEKKTKRNETNENSGVSAPPLPPPIRPPCEKRLFSQLSICLSRAWLGKVIGFTKMLKGQAFFTPRVRVAELLTEVLRQLALLGQRSCPVQRLLVRLWETDSTKGQRASE